MFAGHFEKFGGQYLFFSNQRKWFVLPDKKCFLWLCQRNFEGPTMFCSGWLVIAVVGS